MGQRFDDDFVRLRWSEDRYINVSCEEYGVPWPPPETLPAGFAQSPETLVRISVSEITDEQRAGMTNVCRGAEYLTQSLYDRWTASKETEA